MVNWRVFRAVLDAVATMSVTLAALAVVWSVMTSKQDATAVRAVSPIVENLTDAALRIPITPGTGTIAKKVAMVEFSDFECPFCGRFANETLPRLKAEFLDTKKVEYRFFNFPIEAIHPNALIAAKAAVCAKRQNRFWEMHEWLFKNQRSITPAAILAQTGSMTLREEPFSACLDAAAADVEQDAAMGARVGVRSTPTFYFGIVTEGGDEVSLLRKIVGAAPYETFKSTINELLASGS